jgi:hypothetical protein
MLGRIHQLGSIDQASLLDIRQGPSHGPDDDFLGSARIDAARKPRWGETMVQVGDRIALQSERVGEQSRTEFVTDTRAERR